jgi:hypothetical protein
MAFGSRKFCSKGLFEVFGGKETKRGITVRRQCLIVVGENFSTGRGKSRK